ncbi:hypothetical protein [Flavobacterium sp. HSC-61S13]|uniref:hypothetical protein n=1 Tax=Flavobacterium sp. HSC-61S13 TaxID=2910963 RepID=UPI00209E1F5E|nr:hypothetical protein [Flavobacterium sp. HSC-61S13]MCP1994489.1 hypothetical protein [Flavobacterium sp. HSC-61S13]
MRKITFEYSEKCDLKSFIVNVLGGDDNGNTISCNNKLYTGNHFVSNVQDGISAILIDGKYKDDVYIEQRIVDENIIGLYYFNAEQCVDITLDNSIKLNNTQSTNLLLVDVGLPIDFLCRKGTTIYSVCIFVKKEFIKRFIKQIILYDPSLNALFNESKRSILFNNYLSENSLELLNDFKKTTYNSPFYEFYFKALVFELLNDFFIQIQGDNYFIQNN